MSVPCAATFEGFLALAIAGVARRVSSSSFLKWTRCWAISASRARSTNFLVSCLNCQCPRSGLQVSCNWPARCISVGDGHFSSFWKDCRFLPNNRLHKTSYTLKEVFAALRSSNPMVAAMRFMGDHYVNMKVLQRDGDKRFDQGAIIEADSTQEGAKSYFNCSIQYKIVQK